MFISLLCNSKLMVPTYNENGENIQNKKAIIDIINLLKDIYAQMFNLIAMIRPKRHI